MLIVLSFLTLIALFGTWVLILRKRVEEIQNQLNIETSSVKIWEEAHNLERTLRTNYLEAYLAAERRNALSAASDIMPRVEKTPFPEIQQDEEPDPECPTVWDRLIEEE